MYGMNSLHDRDCDGDVTDGVNFGDGEIGITM